MMMMIMIMSMILCKEDFNAHEHLLDTKTGAKIQICIVDTRDHLGDLEVDGRIVLRGTLNKVTVQAGRSWVSIPDGVLIIFHLTQPSGSTMKLGSTQPLTEMSTSCLFWGVKAAGA
jgi:hypothetical protein